MPQLRHKGRSIVRWLPVAAAVVMVLASVWSSAGGSQAGQTQGNPAVQTPGTPQVTIPYPTWGDGTQPDHMVPGRLWDSAYQSDKWPSERQRSYVQQLQEYFPDLYATWGPRLNKALTSKKLDRRSEMLIASALAGLAHWARPVVEYYIDQAYEAGSNTNEIMSAIEAVQDVSGHGANDGLMGVWYVTHAREAAGKPVPLKGAPYTEKDLIPKSASTPPRFKYHSMQPQDLARKTFEPELYALNQRLAEERRKMQPGFSGGFTPGVSGRMFELLLIAADTAVVRWREPFIDEHYHEALNRGSNLQEVIEVMMVAAELVQGVSDSSIVGRHHPGGVAILAHGLQALNRVMAEREKVGYKTPGEYGEGFTRKMY